MKTNIGSIVNNYNSLFNFDFNPAAETEAKIELNYAKINSELLDELLISRLGVSLSEINSTNMVLYNNFYILDNKLYVNKEIKYIYFDEDYYTTIDSLVLTCYADKSKQIVEYLLKKTRQLNFLDQQNWSPIYYAISTYNQSLVELLLGKNADVFKSNNGMSAFHYLLRNELEHCEIMLDPSCNNYYIKKSTELLKKDVLASEDIKGNEPMFLEIILYMAFFIQNEYFYNAIKGKIDGMFNNTGKESNMKDIDIPQNIEPDSYEYLKDIKNNVSNEYSEREFKTSSNLYLKEPTRKITGDKFTKKLSENTDSLLKHVDISSKKNIYKLPLHGLELKGSDELLYIDATIAKYNKLMIKADKQGIELYNEYWKKRIDLIDQPLDKDDCTEKKIVRYIHMNLVANHKLIISSLLNHKKINKNINKKISIIDKIKKTLSDFLIFINYKYNDDKQLDNNLYYNFLVKLYTHILSSVLGVHFYLTIEKMIIKQYIDNTNDKYDESQNAVRVKLQQLRVIRDSEEKELNSLFNVCKQIAINILANIRTIPLEEDSQFKNDTDKIIREVNIIERLSDTKPKIKIDELAEIIEYKQKLEKIKEDWNEMHLSFVQHVNDLNNNVIKKINELIVQFNEIVFKGAGINEPLTIPIRNHVDSLVDSKVITNPPKPDLDIVPVPIIRPPPVQKIVISDINIFNPSLNSILIDDRYNYIKIKYDNYKKIKDYYENVKSNIEDYKVVNRSIDTTWTPPPLIDGYIQNLETYFRDTILRNYNEIERIFEQVKAIYDEIQTLKPELVLKIDKTDYNEKYQKAKDYKLTLDSSTPLQNIGEDMIKKINDLLSNIELYNTRVDSYNSIDTEYNNQRLLLPPGNIKEARLRDAKEKFRTILEPISSVLVSINFDKSNYNYIYIMRALKYKKNEEDKLDIEFPDKNKIFDEIELKMKDLDDIFSKDKTKNTSLTEQYKDHIKPYYRALYEIVLTHLHKTILNYHKYIYNQYNHINILNLLLGKLTDGMPVDLILEKDDYEEEKEDYDDLY